MLKLTNKAATRIQDMWLNDFHTNSGEQHEYGNASRWWSVITRFLSEQGYELVPAEMREQEERVLRLGLSQNYLAALLDEVGHGHERSAYELAMLVLTASVDEREAALKKVLS